MTTIRRSTAITAVDDRTLYRVYGLTLASEHVLTNRLRAGSGTPDLTFAYIDRPPRAHTADDAKLLWRHPTTANDSATVWSLLRCGDRHVFRYHGVADFYLSDDRIECLPDGDEFAHLIEIRLLGSMLALWLELHGTLALHASAVVVDGGAVAFTSFNKGGKTSLAASLMQQGCPLLTDDLLATQRVDGHWTAHPGYPQMRMWPSDAEFFIGYADGLELVHPHYTKRRVPVGDGEFGTFADHAHPLRCIYFLERDNSLNDGTITLQAQSSLSSMAQLLKHSFVSGIITSAGLQPQRMRQLSDLLQAVPTRRLVHNTRWDELPILRQAVLDDMVRL